MLTHTVDAGIEPVDDTHIDTPDGLASVLRHLRRRLARHCNDSPLTYRELAARTGWAHGVIGDYFAGKTLPPTDRFDILIDLLGTTPAEQRRLATARDRVEELRRSSRTATARAPGPTARPPNSAVGVDTGQHAGDAFVDIARRVTWATLTTVDTMDRPRSRVVRPLWEYGADGLTGWVLGRWNRISRKRLTHTRLVSLSYWHPAHGTAVAQCEADWADDHERHRVWRLATRTPPPHGFDPATVWPAGMDSPDCALLRLCPCQVMSAARDGQPDDPAHHPKILTAVPANPS